MPDEMFEYAKTARGRGLKVIIAGAGGAAHLPGMVAAKCTLPVCGVPIPSKYLRGEDSLLSIVQMPKGVPVGTFAIGEAGAANAALYAVQILSVTDNALAERLAALVQVNLFVTISPPTSCFSLSDFVHDGKRLSVQLKRYR